jgi:hypothetical protein
MVVVTGQSLLQSAKVEGLADYCVIVWCLLDINRILKQSGIGAFFE